MTDQEEAKMPQEQANPVDTEQQQDRKLLRLMTGYDQHASPFRRIPPHQQY